ncbi:hypothetical protein [Helicovermis profundi]|uniref:Uncharacterized protein n=1 Tax=Helicovermis profundi TaxID=3065157 RepID=A0AAU9EAA5_9FIRM|nr:hypothetical protein HLPR_20530 [Clostridia bacterium S502]
MNLENEKREVKQEIKEFNIEKMRLDLSDVENIEELVVPGGSGAGCNCKTGL